MPTVVNYIGYGTYTYIALLVATLNGIEIFANFEQKWSRNGPKTHFWLIFGLSVSESMPIRQDWLVSYSNKPVISS